jgi:hypothetical protein
MITLLQTIVDCEAILWQNRNVCVTGAHHPFPNFLASTGPSAELYIRIYSKMFIYIKDIYMNHSQHL